MLSLSDIPPASESSRIKELWKMQRERKSFQTLQCGCVNEGRRCNRFNSGTVRDIPKNNCALLPPKTQFTLITGSQIIRFLVKYLMKVFFVLMNNFKKCSNILQELKVSKS